MTSGDSDFSVIPSDASRSEAESRDRVAPAEAHTRRTRFLDFALLRSAPLGMTPASQCLILALLIASVACSKGAAEPSAKGGGKGGPGDRQALEFPVEVQAVQTQPVALSVS
ncbi:MAG TPA: hypothetical protein VIL97_11405, partial [Thermoanaerobaculia bacterium]